MQCPVVDVVVIFVFLCPGVVRNIGLYTFSTMNTIEMRKLIVHAYLILQRDFKERHFQAVPLFINVTR